MTQANPENTLRNLILHADDPDIQTRDQFDTDNTVPHIAPGWNAITVLDVLEGMFLREASDRAEDQPSEEAELTDQDIEQAVPGIIEKVNDAVSGNLTSDDLYTALYQETRNIARCIVRDMTPDQLQALLAKAQDKLSNLNPE